MKASARGHFQKEDHQQAIELKLDEVPGADEPGGAQHEAESNELGEWLVLLRRSTHGIRLLRAHEEQALAQRMAAGDVKARDELIAGNFRLVLSIAKRYRGHGVPLVDLFQEGFFGLRRAAEKFDPRYGHKFSTYAMDWIRRACQGAIAAQGQGIVVPFHVHTRRRALAHVAAALTAELRREPTRVELARAAGAEERHVQDATDELSRVGSLDREVGEVGSLVDLVASDDPVDLADEMDRRLQQQYARDVLLTLPPLEREILERRYGLKGGQPETFAEIATGIGLPKLRVRTLERVALETLRPRLARQLFGVDPDTAG